MAALADELPLFKRDGGFVRAGYDAALDESRALRDESRQVIAQLQARYADETGIKSLKIRHNNVLGYFVDVTAQHGEKLLGAPLNATFIHRQTLAGQVRFTTTALGELEAKIASAADRALGIELEIFERLAALVVAASAEIKAAAEALAVLDVSSRARHARGRALLCSPGGRRLARLRYRGRPPCRGRAGDRAIRSSPTTAIFRRPSEARRGANLAAHRPEHGGQVDVSAPERADRRARADGQLRAGKRAKLGVVDRLFSRVGAADDLARGRSTFMVEMVETAAILNQAGERSLVILDEIGRGTATFDGLSIAWAAIEHLHEQNRCRALFATHFHELTALAPKLAASAQRHRPREGMAGRGGVPARSRAGRRRPLLRHPGGEARRPARQRDRARQGGAGDARSRGSREAARLRGSAAVRGAASPGRRPTRARPRSTRCSRCSTPYTPTNCRLARRSRRCTRSSSGLAANISRRHHLLALC